MATATPTPRPTPLSLSRPTAPAARTIEAAQITGYRIMRSTEVAPGWWGQPREVGETGSATVADSFCREQNAVTMDPNRVKRIQYSADPIYGDADESAPHPTAPLPAPAAAALASLVPQFPLVEAVTVYETAAAHVAQLANLALGSGMSDLDADSLAHAEDLMAGARAVLAAAGRLDLIGGGV